jgi:DNA polymerase-3 subunit chi
VVVYAPDENTARAFDKLLWAHRAPSPEALVVIARRDSEMAHYQVILNLHADSPPSFSRFERLVELVGAGDDDRKLARSRFRFYRDRGYEINHYDLSKSSA